VSRPGAVLAFYTVFALAPALDLISGSRAAPRVARPSRAAALAASWRGAARAAAYPRASSCYGAVVRVEAFLLIVMPSWSAR
jgi:hypothetical protein